MSQDQEQQQLFSSVPTSLQLPKSLRSLPSLTIVPHISQPSYPVTLFNLSTPSTLDDQE